MLRPGLLRWADLQRAPAELDGGGLRTALIELIDDFVTASGGLTDQSDVREALQLQLQRFIVERYGPWATLWTWTANEPGGGGPVFGYCCEDHSLLRAEDRGSQPSVSRVMAALESWRSYIFELRANFAKLHSQHASRPFIEELELVAAALLPQVLTRTCSEDAWYATFAQVLVWYVEFTGREPDYAAGLVNEVVGGRFASWSEPSDELGAETCREFARQAALAYDGEPEPVDALATWRSARGSQFANWAACRPRLPAHDGHSQFIERRDRPRSERRADAMLAALAHGRALAKAGTALTFSHLQKMQALVLDRPASELKFRNTRAHAKNGREYYSVDASTQGRFERCLAQANDPDSALSIRAARVYLDVLFFHPFVDGNARAARLALDWVLTREGQAIAAPEPLFSVNRRADEACLGSQFAWLVEQASGPLQAD